MAKDEIVRTATGAAESVAVNVKKSEMDALLLKKKAVEVAEKDADKDDQAPAEEAAAAPAEGEVIAEVADASDALGVATDAGISPSMMLTGASVSGETGGISNTTLLVGGGVLLAGGAIAIASNSGGGGGGGEDGEIQSVVTSSATVAEGGTQATFTITGEPGAVISYSLAGTATIGADYTVSPANQVTLDANGVAIVTVTALTDALTEGAETIILTAGGVSATMSITDASLTVPTTVTASTTDAPEGTVVAFNLTGAPGTTAAFTLSGTSTSADYTVNPTNGVVTFDASGKAQVLVTTLSDNVVENGGETLQLTVNGVTSGVVTINDVAAGTYILTSKIEDATANIFISRPDYTPGGNDLVNTLQDEDTLRGTAATDDLLDAVLGNPNDNSEGLIAPVLIDIETANFQITGGPSGAVSGVDFTSATGLINLGVTRITADDGEILFSSLKEETENLLVANATKQTNTLEFNYAEGQLEGNDDVVNLALNNVRLSSLEITQGDTGDSDEDEGFSAETFNVTVGGTASTNLDYFYLQPNSEEDATDGTDQTVNFVVNQDLEANVLEANGAEFITIQANADFVVGEDEDDINGAGDLELKEFNIDRPGMVPTDGPGFDNDIDDVINEANDGWLTGELQKLTIAGAGNVSIDAVNGDVGLFGDDQGLTVDAGTLTGDLRLGINSGFDSGETGFDDLLKVTSGSGNDWIVSYGVLGGDVTTNGGNDNVEVRGEGFTVMLGTSTIDTGTGDDDVSVEGDLLSHLQRAGDGEDIDFTDIDDFNNDGFDDVQGATILTGDGNDRVSVGALRSSPDGDNGVLDDVNTDDLYFVVGPTISTGAGNDYVEAFELEEGALIETGAGTDSVVIFVDASTVVGADNSVSAGPLDPLTQEVNKDKTLNTLGAIIDLGSENDSILFTDEGLSFDGGELNDYLLVGEGAEVRGGTGTNVFTAEAVDRVDVVSHSIVTDFTNTLITGFQTANFTALNAIGEDTSDATADDVLDDPRVPQNDNGTGFASSGLVADIGRFDSALTTINLTSEEQPVLLDPEFENYEEGNNEVYFELNNLRSAIAVNLIAHETHVEDILTDIEPGGLAGDIGNPADDYIIPLDFEGAAVVGSTLELVDPVASEIFDVRLDVDYDVANAQGNADTFVLNVLPVPAGSTDDGQFDLDLFLNRTEFDSLFDAAASTTDDDDLLIENLVINLTDSASHRFNLNGFGDDQHTSDVLDEGTKTVETSVTINNTKDGTKITVTDVNADTIKILGAADVFLQLSLGEDGEAENNYDIEVGSGDDIIDMRSDTVRPNDGVDDALDAPLVPIDAIAGDSTDETDIVRGGEGRNLLIVDGGNDLGTISPGDTDDDVFENLFDIQTILIEAGAYGSGGQEIVLDEAATEKTHVDTLLFTGRDAQTTDLVIGDDFIVAADAPTGAGVLLIDATDHNTSFGLTIESRDTDTDIQKVNLDVRVNVEDGTDLLFKDTGVEEATVDITVENSDEANTVISDAATGFGIEGELELDVVDGAIDTITILDTAADADLEGKSSPLAALNVEDFDLFVTVSDDWATTALTIDAKDIADTDANDDTGGGLFDLTGETDALLTVTGTQNDDTFNGSSLDDTIFGEAGDDTVFGNLGNDVITGGDGDDYLEGAVGIDKIDGGAGDDTIYGGIDEDVLTGGEGKDTFQYFDVTESNGDSPDTITDFATGVDKIDINVDESAIVADDVWNLGSFFAAPDVGQGDSSLQGTVPAPIRGDYFYATNGAQLVVDLDGNGDVTTLEDYVIGSTNLVAAADVDFTIDLGGGKDVIRLGQGVETLTSSDGDDKFIIVGSIDQAQANAYSLVPDPIGDADVAKVVSKAELSVVRTTTEATFGDSINATGANDTLHLFGNVALFSVPQLAAIVDLNGSIETIVAHSNVAMSDVQFAALDRYTFTGSGPHELHVYDDVTGLELTSADIDALGVTIDTYGSDGAIGGGDDGTGSFIYGSDGKAFQQAFTLDPAATPVVIAFTSSEVGDGLANDGNDDANEDGGLAVRVFDTTTGRYSDEGTTFVRSDGGKFDVQNLPNGVSRGNNFDHVALGTSDDDTLAGIAGNNSYLNAGQGTDTLVGNDGDDFLVGGIGNDDLTGGLGNDTFFVNSDTDSIGDLSTGDILIVGTGAAANASTEGFVATADTSNTGGAVGILASGNVDFSAATGTAGYNVISAGKGISITGSNFSDTALSGDDLKNVISGNAGADTIIGGLDADVLTGGADNDIFVYSTGDAVEGVRASLLLPTVPVNGDSVTGAEIINDIAAGDSIKFGNTNISADGNGVLTSDEYGIYQGTYTSGTNSFTIDAVGGDSIIIFDGDGDISGVQFEHIVLIGGDALSTTFNAGSDILQFNP